MRLCRDAICPGRRRFEVVQAYQVGIYADVPLKLRSPGLRGSNPEAAIDTDTGDS